MKKLIIAFVAFFFVSLSLLADPAKKVNLAYENGKLAIDVIHPVKDANEHFIDQIIILVNKKEFKTIKLTKQSSLKSEQLEIEIPGLNNGAEIVVKTRCNVFGNKSGKLIVTK